jgi:hemoglobin
MKRLLDNRNNIELLVNSFYTRVKADALLGDIFNNVENFSWETHIPIMVDFWETLLLGTTSYNGNPMIKHIELNRRTPLTSQHFNRWKELFYQTLDELFEGSQVQEAKRRVEAMSGLMQYKLEKSGTSGFIQ